MEFGNLDTFIGCIAKLADVPNHIECEISKQKMVSRFLRLLLLLAVIWQFLSSPAVVDVFVGHNARLPDVEAQSVTLSSNSTSVGGTSVYNKPVDCFRPKSFDWSAMPSDGSPLPKPWIHIGLPKSGTTSLEKFWKCGLGDSEVSHSTCRVSSQQVASELGRTDFTNHSFLCPSHKINPCSLCAPCIGKAQNLSLPILGSCGNYAAWAQLDSVQACGYPQVTAIEEIHKEAPKATFVFMFRDMDKWATSVKHFRKGQMFRRLKQCGHRFQRKQPSTSPLAALTGKDYKEMLRTWFCRTVQNARNFVAKYPSHNLLEIDLDDPASVELMVRAFGINSSCWGVHNINNRIHSTTSLATKS